MRNQRPNRSLPFCICINPKPHQMKFSNRKSAQGFPHKSHTVQWPDTKADRDLVFSAFHSAVSSAFEKFKSKFSSSKNVVATNRSERSTSLASSSSSSSSFVFMSKLCAGSVRLCACNQASRMKFRNHFHSRSSSTSAKHTLWNLCSFVLFVAIGFHNRIHAIRVTANGERAFASRSSEFSRGFRSTANGPFNSIQAVDAGFSSDYVIQSKWNDVASPHNPKYLRNVASTVICPPSDSAEMKDRDLCSIFFNQVFFLNDFLLKPNKNSKEMRWCVCVCVC